MGSLFLYFGFTVFLSFISLVLKNNRKSLAFIVPLIMSLFYGLREGVGNDYAQYENIYNQVNLGLYSAIEPTYILISFIFNGTEYGFNYLMVVYSFLTFLFVYIATNKYNIYSYIPFLMLSCGFVFYADNQVRQALATAFFMYYLKYIKTKEFRKYLICVAISSVLFHFSSAILIFAYFIRRKNFSFIFYFLSIASAYLLMVTNAVSYILLKLISIVPYYSELYLQRYNGMQDIEHGSGLGILFWLVISCFIILFRSKINDPVIINLFFVGVLINTVLINYDIFERVSFYFIYMRFILLAIIIKNIIRSGYAYFFMSTAIMVITISFTSYEIVNDANKHGSVPLNLIYFKVSDE